MKYVIFQSDSYLRTYAITSKEILSDAVFNINMLILRAAIYGTVGFNLVRQQLYRWNFEFEAII